jgi:hypothetical protein
VKLFNRLQVTESAALIKPTPNNSAFFVSSLVASSITTSSNRRPRRGGTSNLLLLVVIRRGGRSMRSTRRGGLPGLRRPASDVAHDPRGLGRFSTGASFFPKRNVQQHHHCRISSFLSACPIVSCADVDCYVSGTFNDDLCALFGWFGRRQMAEIQFRSFSPCFFVLLRVFAALSLVRRGPWLQKRIQLLVTSMRSH